MRGLFLCSLKARNQLQSLGRGQEIIQIITITIQLNNLTQRQIKSYIFEIGEIVQKFFIGLFHFNHHCNCLNHNCMQGRLRFHNLNRCTVSTGLSARQVCPETSTLICCTVSFTTAMNHVQKTIRSSRFLHGNWQHCAIFNIKAILGWI